MTSLLDSGPLEALTPDEAGVLREWSMKYAVISEPQTDNATLSIFSSAADVIESEPEVEIPINDCEVQISREVSFERCFTLTANGLKVFLRAANVQERNDWVDSIRHGIKPLPPPSMPPPDNVEEDNNTEEGLENTGQLRTCGYVYVWEEATQQWADLVFLYLSAGFLHEFRAPFRLPTKTHDLTLNCAIRVRGTPPCIEMKLNEHDAILRFYGREEAETLEWLKSIKTRALEPPQRFIDLAVAAYDCFTVEQCLAKSFYIRTGTLNSVLAGTTSTFPVVGTSEDANHRVNDFVCFLSNSFEGDTSLIKGSFHVLADDTLSLHMAYNKQGKYFMHVKFQNDHVFESPFPILVHATVPSAPHSVVSGRGILFAPTRKNKLSKFIVTLRDRYLNLCNTTVDAKRLEVQCFGPASLAQIKYIGEGGFEISYRVANVSSEVSLEVSYAGIPIAGSPFFPVFGEDEEENELVIREEQQMQQPPPPVGDQTTQDLALARRVALRSEAMSSFLSNKIRKEWSNPSPLAEESFPQHEQLEMMMQSAALRLHPSFVTSDNNAREPEFLRSFVVEVDNSKWEPEPLPPPWTSIALVTAQAGRARRDLQACLDPLVQACKDELPTSALLEPKAQWKRTLLDWPGAERASLPQIKQFKLDVSCSPLDHRQVICAMCDAILRIERDLDTRRKAKRQENGGLLAMNDDEEGDEIAIPELPEKQGNHREELRKRVQSLSLGAKPTLMPAERMVKEMQYNNSEAKPLDASLSMPQLEGSEEEDEENDDMHKFSVGNLVVVDGSKVGVVRYVGSTLFADGVWIGLELNTPEGKNNGSINGRKYFACKTNYGLFVRPNRLTSTATPSLPLLLPPNNPNLRQANSMEKDEGNPFSEDEDDEGDIWQSSSNNHHDEEEEEEDDYVQPPQQQRHWDYDDSEQDDEEEHVKPWYEQDDNVEEEEDLFAPSPPSTPLPQQVILALGSLSTFDARDLASGIKARVNSYGRLTREAFVSSIKHWEPMADTQQLVSLFQALSSEGEGKDQVDPVLLNPLLVCLCGTALSNRSAAFYLLDLNRSGLLERDEVERFARAVFILLGSIKGQPPLAQAKQVAESALKRFSALGTSLSFEEFDMWIQNSPAVTGRAGKQGDLPVPIPTTTTTSMHYEDDWVQVERWLEEQVGVTVAFEKKAALEALRESNYHSLAVIAKLTPREVNHLSLSFDLRLRLVTQVRALAKTRKQTLNRLTNAEHYYAPSPLRHPLD
ncbi:hypothetical protein BASA81_010001 [Batrachochytrium salamandrivorans]|nr:hypothetical protein BASA81_010001 [Batrachochytrium salamandrivorans]